MAKGKQILNTRFHATPDQLKKIRDSVREAMDNQSCFPEITDKIVLAVNEACMNIIQHAYGKKECGDILLEIFHNQKEVSVKITDFAEPIDITKCKPRDLKDVRPGGLGTHFINELMDDFEYRIGPENTGNVLLMKRKIVRPE